MNYLGIDYGEKRIGLSYGDDDVRLAVPIAAAVQPTLAARMAQIGELIRTRRIGELVVGYPYNMDGSVGFKAREVDAFIEKLAAQFHLPVHRTDERLTSSDAQSRMKEAGGSKSSRSKQSIRAKLAERKSGTLDSRAATLILQDYLDSLPHAHAGLLFADADDYFDDADYPDAPSADHDAFADESADEGAGDSHVADAEQFDTATDEPASSAAEGFARGGFGARAEDSVERGRGSRKRRGDRRRR